jgi:hypothetical protein
MAATIYRPLKFIAFNVNGIWRQRYELSKLLQDLHTDAVLITETYFKPNERFFVPNYQSDRFPGR